MGANMRRRYVVVELDEPVAEPKADMLASVLAGFVTVSLMVATVTLVFISYIALWGQ